MSFSLLKKISKDYRHFKPRAYLDEYYAAVGSENDGLLLALAHIYHTIGGKDLRLIEIGGGPTVYQLISAAPHVSAIRFTDYSVANLYEIGRWVTGKPQAFNWDLFVERALQYETGSAPLPEAVAERKQLLKSKITTVNRLNVKEPLNLGAAYDVISMHFVAESISASFAEWQQIMHHVLDGSDAPYFIMSGLIGAEHWQSGDEVYSAARISPKDAQEFLEAAGFSVRYVHEIPAEHVPDSADFQGYGGLFTMYAERPTKRG